VSVEHVSAPVAESVAIADLTVPLYDAATRSANGDLAFASPPGNSILRI
jgi:hypothetical protein